MHHSKFGCRLAAQGHSRHSRHPGVSSSHPRADTRPVTAFMSTRRGSRAGAVDALAAAGAAGVAAGSRRARPLDAWRTSSSAETRAMSSTALRKALPVTGRPAVSTGAFRARRSRNSIRKEATKGSEAAHSPAKADLCYRRRCRYVTVHDQTADQRPKAGPLPREAAGAAG